MRKKLLKIGCKINTQVREADRIHPDRAGERCHVFGGKRPDTAICVVCMGRGGNEQIYSGSAGSEYGGYGRGYTGHGALQSDMVYLIQKNDRRLTIRKWGRDYALHEIPSWRLWRSASFNLLDKEI
jgi:hypothetical protein